MRNYKTKVFSTCLTTILLVWAPLTQSRGGVIISDKIISKILPYNFFYTQRYTGRRIPVGLSLIKTSQAMENPDDCTRADYYQVSAPGMTIEQLTTIKINSLTVDLRLNGCGQYGFPIVRWIEF